MDTSFNRLLGVAIWRAAKWYLRRRLPSGRSLALAGAGLVATLAAALAVGRRVSA